MLLKILLAVFAVAALATAVVHWPRGGGANLPPPLTRDEAKALPDGELVDRLTLDISYRLYRGGHRADAWRTLPAAPRALWVATSCTPQLGEHGCIFFLITRDPDGPGLGEVRDAYTTLGAGGVATALGTAVTVEAGSGAAAATRCAEYFRGIGATPFARPPDFSDPFAAADKAIQEELRRPELSRQRIAWVRAHLDELVP